MASPALPWDMLIFGAVLCLLSGYIPGLQVGLVGRERQMPIPSRPEVKQGPIERVKTRVKEGKQTCCHEQMRDRRFLWAGAVCPAGLSMLGFLEIQQGNEILGSLMPISTH